MSRISATMARSCSSMSTYFPWHLARRADGVEAIATCWQPGVFAPSPVGSGGLQLREDAGLVSPTFVGQDDLKEEDGDVWIVFMLLLFGFVTFPLIPCRVC